MFALSVCAIPHAHRWQVEEIYNWSARGRVAKVNYEMQGGPELRKFSKETREDNLRELRQWFSVHLYTHAHALSLTHM